MFHHLTGALALETGNMAEQLKSLFPLYSTMSRDEQLSFIHDLRVRKHTERPAAKKRERKARAPKRDKAAKLLDGLSPKQMKELLEALT